MNNRRLLFASKGAVRYASIPQIFDMEQFACVGRDRRRQGSSEHGTHGFGAGGICTAHQHQGKYAEAAAEIVDSAQRRVS
ncbi:hypothetical protein H0178_22235 [Cytobacillus firmus]|nr:hypothetical protein [Cytobacillus firmus]